MKTKKTITVAEIDRQIHEEIARLKKIDQIKSRLKVVTEELKRLGENGIDEVEVGGHKDGEQWYQKGTPVAKFEKKGSHMLEADPTVADDDLSGDMPPLGDDMGAEDGMDMGEAVPETFEEKLAAIGRELDMKLSGDAVGEPVMDAPATDDMDAADAAPDGDDDKEVDADTEIDLDADVEEEKPEEDEIEIDEAAIDVVSEEEVKEGENPFAKKEEKDEECMEEEKAPMNESVDRLGKKKNPLLEAELKRAQRLAGLED